MRIQHRNASTQSRQWSSVSHLAGLLCVLLLASCGGRTTEGPLPAASSTPDEALLSAARHVPASTHIVFVMEENTGYSGVVDNTSEWPNLNRLIRTGSLATRYYANTHPSIGNYFMLTTGELLTNNDNSTTLWNVNNIARLMIAHGIYFKVYAEGAGRGYTGGNTGAYLLRHNPFARLSDTAGSGSEAYRYLWPFSQFAADTANGLLPTFSFIVPDANHDAHSASAYEADQWLQSQVVEPISRRPAFAPNGAGLLIVAFDEASTRDSAYGGGHTATVFWGPLVKPGYRQSSGTLYQHQSLLHTIVDALNLPNAPGAAASAPPMAEFFK